MSANSRDINDLLTKKKQAILYGPPGTGKTYEANKIAFNFLNNNFEDRQDSQTMEISKNYNKKEIDKNKILSEHIEWLTKNSDVDMKTRGTSKGSILVERFILDFYRGKKEKITISAESEKLENGYFGRKTRNALDATAKRFGYTRTQLVGHSDPSKAHRLFIKAVFKKNK